MQGVVKKTINLPEQLKARIVRMAREQNRYQAALIKDAVEKYVSRAERFGRA